MVRKSLHHDRSQACALILIQEQKQRHKGLSVAGKGRFNSSRKQWFKLNAKLSPLILILILA